ncbi:protein FANTASTIC FOUR 1 [Jatropha curcas]|uniref:protein FANTASTIC FOUR 1 n=1 Tax=Jatropha curcas TaxID=180498 RepID=UPI0005FA9F54|nr:protein FANTASTIC FOUR 1 [Jatropha curcas]
MLHCMMSFCKKSVHSFLGLTIPTDSNDHTNTTVVQEKPSKCLLTNTNGGLGLISATGDFCKTPNILESATVKSSSPPIKKDPGGIGFLDDVGGGVNGLMSCTESLGFESCDERRVDDEIDELLSARTDKVKWRKIGERRREVKKFPPPISSLNHNGQPCFFLRPVRKDGRLELTEVRIDRPEILRAHREDGRLRLHLIRDDEDLEDINEEKQPVQEQEEEEEEEEVQEEEEEEEEEEEREGDEWRFPVNGEGLRRCHEVATQPHHHHHHHHNHHNHNLHVWRQHCVTTS